jgi:hypothetical protein
MMIHRKCSSFLSIAAVMVAALIAAPSAPAAAQDDTDVMHVQAYCNAWLVYDFRPNLHFHFPQTGVSTRVNAGWAAPGSVLHGGARTADGRHVFSLAPDQRDVESHVRMIVNPDGVTAEVFDGAGAQLGSIALSGFGFFNILPSCVYTPRP